MDTNIHEKEPTRDPELSSSTWGNRIRQTTRDMVVTAMAFTLFITFVMQSYAVDGTSMEPTLLSGERVIAEKISPRWGEIESGQVVVLLFPADVSKRFIKRVIGTPGDLIEIRHGRTFINGQQIDESYVSEEFRTSESMGPKRIPAGYFFVMGDHRSVSYDSRTFGFVPERYIQGHAIASYWPPSKLGLVH